MGQAREGARHQGGVGRIVPRFIVPFGRDGAADRAARAFADAFGSVDVENLPGEGGLAGVRRANSLAAEARSAVFLLGTPTTHILLPARLGRDAAPDAAFAPLMGLGSAPNVLLVSPRLGVATVDELLGRAKAETLTYASAGAGQTIHLCTEYLCALAGVRMMHRPYDSGSATAYEDLVAGRVHVYFDNLLGCRDFVARGEARALAVSATARNRLLPDVPTLAECGFPDHALEIGFGVFGAGLDETQARRLQAVGADPQLSAAFERIGLSGGVSSASALARQVERSDAAWKAALATAIGA